MVQRYSNLSGDSGVYAYKPGANYIDVQFKDGAVYRYMYSSAGKVQVQEMKRLAAAGRGLTTYINRHVKKDYAARLN